MDGILNLDNASPQDKAILMLMERVDQLERGLVDMHNTVETSIIKKVIHGYSRPAITTLDIFLWLLGSKHGSICTYFRFRVCPRYVRALYDDATDSVKERARQLNAIQGGSPVWEWFATNNNWGYDDYTKYLRYDDYEWITSHGDNLSALLDALTDDELRAYWAWRNKLISLE